MGNFWSRMILDNSVKDWAICFSIIIGSIFLLRLFQIIVVKRLKLITRRTKTTIDDFIVIIIQSSLMPILYLLAVYFGLNYIKITTTAEKIMRIAMLLFVTFFVLRVITSFIAFTFREALKRKEKNEQREKQAKGILLIIQVIVWVIGLLFLIDNLGYNITTLVAGLGIGGIAIALAAQTILGDIFSYLVIFFDKPFEIGDFITIQDKMGTVEYIGIKTTRIRSLNGEQLIISNTDLTNSRLHNYKRMQERRIQFSFGVVYSTAASKLKNIAGQIKQIIDTTGDTRFERTHFKSFESSSLNFEVVYYILSPDYNVYMDRQQSINLRIFELFEKEQIEFAFPTQTVFLNKANQEEK